MRDFGEEESWSRGTDALVVVRIAIQPLWWVADKEVGRRESGIYIYKYK